MPDRIRLDGITVNAPDALALAEFYAEITGGVARGDTHWAAVAGPNGFLAFQQVADFRPPTWPDGSPPMHMHLDFHVEDLEATGARARAAGATRLDAQPNSDHCIVYADPAGHPFCLSTWAGQDLFDNTPDHRAAELRGSPGVTSREARGCTICDLGSTEGARMSPLDRLPGTWDLTMRHADVEEPVLGRHRYEWVLDRAFLQLRSEYERPDFPDAMALLTPERYHYFDVRGVVREFDLTVVDDGWSTINVTGDGLSQRTTARFAGDDTVEVTGDRSTDTGATWEPDFTMTLRRA